MLVTEIKTYRMWAGTRNWLFVKLETDAGVYGWGEGSLEMWDDVVETAIHNLSRLVIGRDPLDVGAINFDLNRRSGWRGGAILGSAVSALDLALWDIIGKIHDLPVYRLLGGAHRQRMRAYLSGGYTFKSTQEAITLARAAIAQGFTALKANPAEARRTPFDYQAVEQTVDVLRALRETIGWEVDLLLDCHGSPTPPLGSMLAEAIAPYRPLFLEEPAQDSDVSGTVEVARKSPVPIATGEKVTTIQAFRELCERRAAAILQPDIVHVGGITGMMRIAAMAESFQVWIAPHNATGPVGTSAVLHAAAAMPNFMIQEIGLYALPFFDQILRKPIKIEDGFFLLPDGPGLGVELNEEAIAVNPPQPMPLREYRHSDGSWSGW